MAQHVKLVLEQKKISVMEEEMLSDVALVIVVVDLHQNQTVRYVQSINLPVQTVNSTHLDVTVSVIQDGQDLTATNVTKIQTCVKTELHGTELLVLVTVRPINYTVGYIVILVLHHYLVLMVNPMDQHVNVYVIHTYTDYYVINVTLIQSLVLMEHSMKLHVLVDVMEIGLERDVVHVNYQYLNVMENNTSTKINVNVNVTSLQQFVHHETLQTKSLTMLQHVLVLV